MVETQLKALIIKEFGSIRQFSITIDMAYSTLDNILRRGVNNANINNIIKICVALNINADDLAKGYIVHNPAEKIGQDKKIPVYRTIYSSPRLGADEIAFYETVQDSHIDYGLIVRDESMVNVSLFENDIVYVTKNAPITNGDMVVSSIDNQPAVIRRIYQYGNLVFLRPENPREKETEYSEDSIEILGKVKSALIKF